jgi:pSer/pThr/pTyr-binding forkhead associated (FHA) protein
MNLGAQDYITKPFTRKELLESVNARLKQTHQSSTNSNSRVTQYFVSVVSPAHPEGETFELQDITLIGRSKECQIQLQDRAVSRFNCTFQKKRNTQTPGYYLVDGTIGKTPQPCKFGLWIEGTRVDGMIELKGGEKIQVAPSVFLEYKVKKPDNDDSTSSTEF